MANKVKYNEELSASENTAFVALFFLSWLGILLLILRKKKITRKSVLLHEYLLFIVSFLYWFFLFMTTEGVVLALTVAALGSLCFGTYLLFIEESHMNKWSITVRNTPIVIMLLAILLPIIFFDLAGMMRNIPAGDATKCVGEIRMAGIMVLAVIIHFLFAAKTFLSNQSLLSNYFHEIPDNEGIFLILSIFGFIAVITWPHFNENVPNFTTLVASCVHG